MFTPIGFYAETNVLPPLVDTATLFYSANRNTDWTDLTTNGNDGTVGTLGSGGGASITHIAGATPYWQFTAPNPLTEQKFLDTNYAKTVSGDYSVILVISLSDVTTNNIQGVGGLATPSGNASFNIGQNTTQRFYHGNKGASAGDDLFAYGNTILSTDTFYMVTVVGDSSGIRVYNNNRLDGSDSSNGTTYASSETFVLGRDIGLTANYVNNQKVAAYAFFDGTALDATQRTELYDYYNEIYNLPQPSGPPLLSEASVFYSADQNTDWTDLTTNGNDGTEVTVGSGGGSSITHIGGATPYWQFTTTDPLTERPHLDTGYGLSGGQPWTVMVVVSFDDLTNNWQGVGGYADPDGNELFGFNQNLTEKWFVQNRGTNSGDNLFTYDDVEGVLSEDTWYMLLVVGDSSGIHLYTNNVTGTSDTSNAATYANAENITLGRDGALISGYKNQGKIASWAIFEKALSSAERTELFDYYNAIYSF